MHWTIERILVGRADRQTIAKYAAGVDRYLGIGLMLSAALLGLAMTQPLMTAIGFMGLDGEYSLLGVIGAYFQNGQHALALLVAAAVILLPVVLLSTAFDIWYKHELSSGKFLRKSALLRLLGQAVLPILAVVSGALFLAGRDVGVALHLAAGYLIIYLALQKLVVARMRPLLDAVQFVEEEKS